MGRLTRSEAANGAGPGVTTRNNGVPPPSSSRETPELDDEDLGTGDPDGSASAGSAEERLAENLFDVEWDEEEQKVLEDGLQRYSADSHLARYVKIAAELRTKGSRDVALRVRWMQRKEGAGRKRKTEENGSRRPVKSQRVEGGGARGGSVFAARPHPGAGPQPMPPQYAMPPPVPVQLEDHGADTVGNVGGRAHQLLLDNITVMNQIRQNMQNGQMQENADLLAKMRDNVNEVMSSLKNMPGIVGSMPELPVAMTHF